MEPFIAGYQFMQVRMLCQRDGHGSGKYVCPGERVPIVLEAPKNPRRLADVNVHALDGSRPDGFVHSVAKPSRGKIQILDRFHKTIGAYVSYSTLTKVSSSRCVLVVQHPSAL